MKIVHSSAVLLTFLLTFKKGVLSSSQDFLWRNQTLHAYLRAIAALSCPGYYYRIVGNFCWSKEIFAVVLHAQVATTRTHLVLPPPFILEEFHNISIFSAGLTVIYVKICIYKIMKMFCCCIDLHRCCWDVLKQVCWNQWRRADQFHGESASHKWCLPCLLWLWVLGSRLITVSLPVFTDYYEMQLIAMDW